MMSIKLVWFGKRSTGFGPEDTGSKPTSPLVSYVTDSANELLKLVFTSVKLGPGF